MAYGNGFALNELLPVFVANLAVTTAAANQTAQSPQSLAESPVADDMIRVRGAATHNLREVDLDLPRNQMIVFCGVSGSGKTSMAIDTLYAEGQRRYIESFSTYTRQFLEQLDKPEVDQITGLPPAIAVTQHGSRRSNRATVATATEIADHLRLLFAKAGEVICPGCGEVVRRDSVESIVDATSQLAEGTRLMLAFETQVPPKEEIANWLAEFVQAGYVRMIYAGRMETVGPELTAKLTANSPAHVVLDRIVIGKTDQARTTESIETALIAGEGQCVLLSTQALPNDTRVEVDEREWFFRRFSTQLRCNACEREFLPPEPSLLNFNSPLGACPECEGFGSVVETDMNLVVPDRSKTLRQGAVAPWNTPAYAHELEELLALADDYDLPVDVPFDELTPDQFRLVEQGVPERDFGGLNGFFRWLERRKYKMHLRVFLSRWRSYRPCEACHGDRLRPEALAVRIGGVNFAEFCRQKTSDAIALLDRIELSDSQRTIGGPMLAQVLARMRYLDSVGVGYLTLDRTIRTLSTGEAQRVAMTSTLGSNLVDMLYVLDEPSAGLHPADVPALAGAITKLRERGNTVVVVEHETAIISQADQVLEFGPNAGVEGGEIVFQGTPAELLDKQGDRTGDWLAGRRASTPKKRRAVSGDQLRLLGASGHNLQSLDLEIPLGVMTVVTGVSGAGKSSLILQTLQPALHDLLQRAKGADAKLSDPPPLPHKDLLGAGTLENVLLIDGQPIARSPRSNPVTYIKAFDPIRALFAEQPDAAARGMTASHFSFNVDGGRCETCQGAGYLEVDMQFMPDVYMKCRECDGRRYRREVLDVRYRGRDISEVLEMTAHEAFRFFRGQNKVQAKLKVLLDVGLDYLRLGQPANTLSGGEAQRLKLAGCLAGKQSGRTLFILDEPTTGLHFSDVVQLIDCFDALVDVGHSLLVVEHNVQMMMAADWLIDLGPGPADEGGKIVVAGTPETVSKCEASATGRELVIEFDRQAKAMAELDALEAAMEDE